MGISENEEFYENALGVTRAEMEEIDQEIETELARAQERVAELQEARKAALQMHAAACRRLGVPNELEGDEK